MITIEVRRDEVTAGLANLRLFFSDLTPAMQDIGEYLVKSTKERFPAGLSPDGAPWAPKSPVTMDRQGARRSNRYDPRPLFGPTGALSRQIFHRAGPDQVEWGSPMIYAAVQQFGAAQGAFGRTSRNGPIPWGNIPARPFLGVSPEDESHIFAIIDEWVLRAGGESA